MSEYILFGTEGCHLCEEAENLLEQAAVDYLKRDIAGDGKWMERYAVRIPVLCHPGSRKELGWPFDASRLQAFVSEHQCND